MAKCCMCQEIFLLFVYLKKPDILAGTPGLYHTLAALWRLQLLILVQGQDKHLNKLRWQEMKSDLQVV